MSNVVIKEFHEMDSVIDVIFELEEQIFEKPYSKEKLLREARTKNHLLVLIAYEDDKALGYKIGYEMTSRLYYSWIGGVIPEARGRGVARKLMEEQHQRVKTLGHSCIRTHTENKYREMLILNLKVGFDIAGVFKSEHDEKQTIILEKVI